MKDAPPDSRYAPPQAPVRDLLPADSADQLASRGRRFVAALCDIAIEISTTWLLAEYTPINLWLDDDASLWSLQAGIAGGGFLLFLALHGALLARRGQTLGKVLLGIRIALPNGQPAPLGQLIGLRYAVPALLNIVPAVGLSFTLIDSLFIFRASRRCLHDSIAGTVVLNGGRARG
jgi:uncharacterized RDD family membrane protein YckC